MIEWIGFWDKGSVTKDWSPSKGYGAELFIETISYHVVPLYSIVPVVQRAENAIHWLTHYLVDSAVCLSTCIYWIAIS